MSAPSKIRGTLSAALLFLITVLAGCGGSGGAKSGVLVDATSSYKGATSQAQATAANAESLAYGALGGESIGIAIGARASKAVENGGANAAVKFPVRQMVQTLKLSLRRMEIPKKAALLRNATSTAQRAKATTRTSTYQVTGSNGGTASYSLEINDATNTFFGSVVYQGFNSTGVSINGKADLLGTFDPNKQEISRLTLSFKPLTMASRNATVSLIGSLSWVSDFTSSTESMSMDFVLINQADSKTYWYNNYAVTTQFSGATYTQTVTGRYYDHDYGFVNVSTAPPLVGNSSNQYPSQGTLLINGKQGSWASIAFFSDHLSIEADTDGIAGVDFHIDRATNVVPPSNSQPTANAGPDQSAAQWSVVNLDGSASSDPNGDPLTYTWSFVSTPGNGYQPLTGANTATPSFNANVAGTYVLSLTVYDGSAMSLADTVTVVVAPAAPLDPTAVKQQWQYGIYGSSIGMAGLFTVDIDGDGTLETIASASAGGFGDNVMWYVVRRNAAGGYEQVWRSENYGVTVVRMLLTDLNGDGKDDIVVALADGTVRVYDGPTLQAFRTISVVGSLKDLAVGDLDGDGKKELIATNGIGIFVYDATTGASKWSISSYGGSSIAVGNVDSDPALEIVTASYGAKGYVINGITGAVKWEYLNGFGSKVRLADLDGDGMQEIVAASPWYKITVLDADDKSPAWEIATDLDIAAVVVTDTDGDGVPEILYGDNQWGGIHAIDVRTKKQRWSVSNPASGVSGIAMGDVDQDGKKELLWGGGGNTSGADFLFITDPLTGVIKWKSLDFQGLSSLTVGDLDNDGEDEIVMVSNDSNSGYGGGIISIFNARSHVLKSQDSLGDRDWMGAHRAVQIADVDGDGRNELTISTSDLYGGFVRVYDGATRAIKKQSAAYEGNFFSAIAIGDVDGDGKVEIVAGQGREHTGAAGVYLVVFDGSTLQEKWRSVGLGVYWGSIYDIKLADLDGDGHQEIIASMTDSRLIIFDGVTHTLKLMIETPARALAVADVDGDGFPELLVGRYDGKIDVYDGRTYTVKKSVSTFGISPIDALVVANLGGSGSKDWLVAGGGILSILEGETLISRSGYLGNNLGMGNHIAVKDTDADGNPDIFVGTDPALYQFQYRKTQ